MNNTYVVIMAGGIGSRFWPLSTAEYPKQFLDILGIGKSLLQITVERFLNICPLENILIVTNSHYESIVKEQLPGLLPEHILLEPQRRNTAPCIAYANYVISQKCSDPNIVVAPSDHLILNENEFVSKIQSGLSFVSKNNSLLTLGIKPSRPDTGYGYIQMESSSFDVDGLSKVKTFTEKPDIDTAKFFLSSGEFLWNSGIFLWSLSTINHAFETYLPDLSGLFASLANDKNASIETIYAACSNISIDYGIMEKADNVFVSPSDFGWSDLGTWGSLYDNTPKDSSNNSHILGDIFSYDSDSNLIRLPKGKIGVIEGLSGFIVVDAGDKLLICRKTEEQRIKQFVNDIENRKA